METTGSVAPISNEQAEQLIIGRILVDPEAIKQVLPALLPEDFTHPVYQEIYHTVLLLQRLQYQHTAPPVEAVSAWLMAVNLLSTEIKASLQECQAIGQATDGETLLPAVQLVMTKRLRRITASMGKYLIEMAGDFSLPVDELFSRAAWSAERLQELLPSCVEQGDA